MIRLLSHKAIRWRRRLGVLLAAAALQAATPGLAADAEPTVAPQEAPQEAPREYLIKAAILYNFAKFTRWPESAFASADAPLQLCVLGVDPFGEALATVDGKRVGGRQLRTRLMGATSDLAGCHMLFISASEEAHLAAVLQASAGQPILTVADLPGFAAAGGTIALQTVDDRSRFNVNLGAAEQADLKLSAKLLRLADRVIQANRVIEE